MKMVAEGSFEECRHRRALADQRAIDVVADLMAEGRDHRARMMRGVQEDDELALRADIGAAEEASQREAGAFEIWLGAEFQLAARRTTW